MEHQSIEIKRILEKLLCVQKLIHSEAISEKKKEILKNRTKRRIYELCDGKRTVNDLTKIMKTSQPNVSYHLASLLESGLLLYEDVGSNRYYFKSLE